MVAGSGSVGLRVACCQCSPPIEGVGYQAQPVDLGTGYDQIRYGVTSLRVLPYASRGEHGHGIPVVESAEFGGYLHTVFFGIPGCAISAIRMDWTTLG